MTSDQASNRYYQLVRDFAIQTQDWEPAIRYFTQPDERLDLTLVSRRLYGTSNETLTIQAAAGLDSPEYMLREQALVLPMVEQLVAMRRQAGFADYEIS